MLGTLALFGDMTLTFVRVFPLAAWPILGALWVIGLPAMFPDNDLVPLLT